MNTLTALKCVPCKGGEPLLSDAEITDLQNQALEWQVVVRDSIKRLERIFKFRNFVESLAFTNQVAKIAEEQGHHPVLVTEWGRVTVTWWTHKIKGLHRNDFIMAAKTDQIYAETNRSD